MNCKFNKSLFIFLCIIVIIILYYLLQYKNTDTFKLLDTHQNNYFNELNILPFDNNQQLDNNKK